MLAGMTLLTSDIIVAAPAERVWQVVAHRFDRIGEWATRHSRLHRGRSGGRAGGRPGGGKSL
jgi:hypothetical protein